MRVILGAIDAMFASDDPGSPQRELDVRSPVERPAGSRMDAQWPLAIQPGDAGRRCNQMALFSTCRLRTIDQPARPDALATGGPVVEQTKPLRPPSTPWADEQRPRSAHRRRQTPGWRWVGGGSMRSLTGYPRSFEMNCRNRSDVEPPKSSSGEPSASTSP
jgi:hypothetical protein